jgi:hypothetical protein
MSVGILPVVGIFLAFAFLYAVMFSNFIRHYASTGTYCTSDDCALTAAHQATYNSSACR